MANRILISNSNPNPCADSSNKPDIADIGIVGDIKIIGRVCKISETKCQFRETVLLTDGVTGLIL